MTIFESAMSARHFNHSLAKPLIQGLARIMTVVLIVYTVVRFMNLIRSGNIAYALQNTVEAQLFWVEMGLIAVVPITMLMIRAVRENPVRLYVVSILVVSGFVLNRLNIAITGMQRALGVHYVPKWTEISVTLMIVAAGITIFTLAVKYLPIFEHPVHAR
jgi:Ni/Fe-hydrogenase subunit HybB-like protein